MNLQQAQKAMSLPSLERVKNMAFIKRDVFKKICLKMSMEYTFLCCFATKQSFFSCAIINNSSFAHLIFYY